MYVRSRSHLVRRVAPLTGGAFLACLFSLTMGPLIASAAPTTPPATVSCAGTINPDPNGPAAGNANPFDYSFSCTPALTGATDPTGYTWNFTGNIWSYTIVVTRRNDDGNNVTYNAPTATILNAGAVDATQYVNCSSAVPSDGFSCSAPGPGASNPSDLANGANPPYLSYIPAGERITGGFSMAEGYCSFLPKGAKPGTPAVPRATVEVIVTDTNGVSEGPFELTRAGGCKKVPATVPVRKRKVKKASARHARGR